MKKLHSSAERRGFTLVELMIVVAIIGVLATLGTYGVRKYILSAKSSEAMHMIGSIRAAEEAYRSEAFVYLGGDDFTTWHPRNTPGTGKASWNTTTSLYTNVFQPLGVQATGAVSYSYTVVDGTVDDAMPTSALPSQEKNFNFPAPPGPWYVVMAKADLNGNNTFQYMLSSSLSNSIYTENER